MTVETRWLDRAGVAAYLSVRVDALPRLARRGKLPAPSYHLGARSPRWDRLALDSALSGTPSCPAIDPDAVGAAAVQAILAAGRRRGPVHGKRRPAG